MFITSLDVTLSSYSLAAVYMIDCNMNVCVYVCHVVLCALSDTIITIVTVVTEVQL